MDLNVQFLKPDTTRDMPFADAWLINPESRETLLNMGNAEEDIKKYTHQRNQEIIEEYLYLEAQGKQVTRAIVVEDITVGYVWIELVENHGIKPPALHIMIGDPDYRGKGVGRISLQWAISHIKNALGFSNVHTRHLVKNIPITNLLKSLGFKKDGDIYTDEQGLVWQKVILKL